MDLHSKYTFLLAQKATPFQVGKARWLYKSAQKCRFFSQKHFFMLFLERNREFSSCSLREICKFQITEDKANAHAGMPFCGVSRFAISTFQSVFGFMTKGQQPFWGVGRSRLSVIGMQSLTQVNRSEPAPLFCIHSKLVLCFRSRTRRNSIGVNNGDCYGLGRCAGI